jgi:hypothetical protein
MSIPGNENRTIHRTVAMFWQALRPIRPNARVMRVVPKGRKAVSYVFRTKEKAFQEKTVRRRDA